MTSEEESARPASDDVRSIISATNISVTFGGITALDNAHISVDPRTIVGLVGPNGAGKSTLFSVLSGLERSGKGTVHLGDEDVTHASPQRRARLGLARTFQHPHLFDTLTVAEHLALAYRVHHSPRRLWSDLVTRRSKTVSPAEREDVDETLTLLRLTRYANAEVRSLPLGISRLVEVAQAIATRPKVVLLDEPSAGLNSHETGQLTHALREVAARHQLALLLVEHDLDMVLGLSEKVFVLEFGKIIATGTPAEIRRDDAVLAAYLGVPTGRSSSA